MPPSTVKMATPAAETCAQFRYSLVKLLSRAGMPILSPSWADTFLPCSLARVPFLAGHLDLAKGFSPSYLHMPQQYVGLVHGALRKVRGLTALKGQELG